MSRNASGVYSLPNTHNPVVSRTPILTDWWNTTSADIAQEITSSLDRAGRGAMTAPLQLPDGTAAAPALTFSGDTNTGAYRVGTDQIGLSTGGTLRVTIGTTALTIAAALQASAGAVGTPAYSFSTDTNSGMYSAGADDLRIAAGGVDIAKFTTKLSASAATAATGGTRQDALSLTNGDIDLSAVTAPDSTTSVANRITPMNFIKAWAFITCSAAAPSVASVTAGFNITSVSAGDSGTSVTVTWGGDFASANYGVGALSMDTSVANIVWSLTAKAAGSATLRAYVANTGTPFDFDTLGTTVFVFAIGAQ